VKFIDTHTHEVVTLLIQDHKEVFVLDGTNDILIYDLDFFQEYFRKLL